MIKLSNVVFKIVQIFGHTSYVDVTKWKEIFYTTTWSNLSIDRGLQIVITLSDVMTIRQIIRTIWA